jgi:predicted TPR repeat methyltransferase
VSASYEASSYGQHAAPLYDSWIAPAVQATTAAAVRFLADIVGNGRALELGIGTGRVALPLAAAGARVEGIDASEAMLSRLREKPGGYELTVSTSDFVDVAVAGRFKLIYVVFNTFFAMLTQEDQVRCFKNVAAHLEDGGAFVIEAFVPTQHCSIADSG